jgi:hypothetical protein
MLVSKIKYAELSGVDVQTIYARIKKHYIRLKKSKLPDGSIAEFIDTKKFPPGRIRKSGGGRKRKSKSSK